MGIFDKKQPAAKDAPETVSQAGGQKLYRIAVTTSSETYNFQLGQTLENCKEEVKKIISTQCFQDGTMYIPYPQIKKIEILGV